MMKFTIACVAVAAFAAPAFADEPTGSFVYKDNQDYSTIENQVGELSARIIQNGQFVSGNLGPYDQTTAPGSRAEAVQDLLVQTGRGRDK